MTTRAQKLAKLKDRQNAPNKNAETLTLSIETFKSSVDELISAFGEGVDINDIDKIMASLETVGQFGPTIDKLAESIQSFHIPELPASVKIDGLKTFIETLEQIKIQPPEVTLKTDSDALLAMAEQIKQLINIFKDNVYKGGQRVGDFIPVRRVRQIDKNGRLVFDDESWVSQGGFFGGGGSGSIPTEIVDNQTRVPITNKRYGDVMFDPDDSAPTYIGLNATNGASTAAATWILYKFTYSGANTTRIQSVIGSWDGRASAF